jgi:hypothetical protein
MRLALICAALAAALAGDARADCRNVEIAFQPVANLQIAVWIEDDAGNYVDTAYVSRLTGSLGLANRPGNGGFKTDFRFPYGRRDMVLPIWAHKRNHHYGYVVMGGKPGNSIAACAASGVAGSECDDETIGYHFACSSPEPFYCSPTGGRVQHINGVDVISCASGFYGSKGAYADPPAFSLYPPRADLTSFVSDHDGPDAMGFSTVNDLVAVSGATPAGMAVVDPPIRWTPPADGHYIAKIEVSLERDFNMYHNHPNVDDEHAELNGYGHDFFGQPSIVYEVPFQVGSATDVEIATHYIGYSIWDGSDGNLRPADMTISDVPGTGAGRLLDTTDNSGTWRVRVRATPCTMPVCQSPRAPEQLTLTPHSTSIDLAFASAVDGPAPARFDVRYRETNPITEADFLTARPSSTMPPPPGTQGSKVTTSLTGLNPTLTYYVAVRALSMCDAASPIVVAKTETTKPDFVVLHGCFIATAAYGTPLAHDLDALRRLRDRRLLTNPLGRLAVATYYAFSPPIARAIASSELLRSGARAVIAPLVALSRAAQ